MEELPLLLIVSVPIRFEKLPFRLVERTFSELHSKDRR